jgi:hypothetical protein
LRLIRKAVGGEVQGQNDNFLCSETFVPFEGSYSWTSANKTKFLFRTINTLWGFTSLIYEGINCWDLKTLRFLFILYLLTSSYIVQEERKRC